MRQYLLLIVVVCCGSLCRAQADSTLKTGKQKWLYHEASMGAHEESSLGLVPELIAFPNFAYGFSLMKGRFITDGFGGAGHGYGLGYTYLPSEKASVLSVSAFGSANIIGLGLYGAAKGLCFMQGNCRYWALRPEIGYGIIKLNLFYGYNFFMGPRPENLPRYVVGASYYQCLYPAQVDRSRQIPPYE